MSGNRWEPNSDSGDWPCFRPLRCDRRARLDSWDAERRSRFPTDAEQKGSAAEELRQRLLSLGAGAGAAEPAPSPPPSPGKSGGPKSAGRSPRARGPGEGSSGSERPARRCGARKQKAALQEPERLELKVAKVGSLWRRGSEVSPSVFRLVKRDAEAGAAVLELQDLSGKHLLPQPAQRGPGGRD